MKEIIEKSSFFTKDSKTSYMLQKVCGEIN